MANVLVVGGAGYIGGALVDGLLKTEHNVRVYDNLLYENEWRKPVDFIFGDVRDESKITPNLKWADVVVWLAALVGDGACAAFPDIAMDLNAKRVEWLAQHFDGRIIFASTCSVYGANEGVLNEAAALNPLSVYASSKVKAEPHVLERNGIVFRLGTLFGIGDNYSRVRMDLVVNYLTARAYYHGKVTIFGGDQYRPLLHVKDAANAMLMNVTSKHSGVFNLHTANMSVKELAGSLEKEFPSLNVEHTDRQFEDNRNYRVSSEKAIRAFGFKPRYSVLDGISEIKELLASGRIKDVTSPRYSNSETVRSMKSI